MKEAKTYKKGIYIEAYISKYLIYVNVNERRFQFITEVTRQTKDELSQKE